MFKKIFCYFWGHRITFIKYVLVGSSSALIDIGGFALLFYLGFYYILAAVISQACALIYNFSLNRTWSFKCKEHMKRQMVRYAIMVSCNYTLALILLYVGVDIFGFHEVLTKVGISMIAVCWNFILYRQWVFK